MEKPSTQIYRDLYGDAKLVPNLDGHKDGGRKPTETSGTEFCYKKREFTSRGSQEHQNNTVSNTRTFQITKFPEIPVSHFFNRRGSYLARHINAASRKS